jgi:short-subunit dehydrogenase
MFRHPPSIQGLRRDRGSRSVILRGGLSRASGTLWGMSNSSERRTALITGASAGIGKAIAEVFADQGFDLVLTARRIDRLHEVARGISSAHGVKAHVIAADLADPAAPATLVREITEAGLQIDVLVNNAGYGLVGSFLDSTWKQHADFLQVMVVAVADLTHRLLPGMIARKYGRIINVASVAGMVPPTAGHTLYGAAKALMIRFSQSLAGEVRQHGVHVTALCPGFTYSEFHDVNGMRERVSRLPKLLWLDADSVARLGYDAVMRGQAVAVTGWIYRSMVWFGRHAPEWLVRRLMRSQARNFRKT